MQEVVACKGVINKGKWRVRERGNEAAGSRQQQRKKRSAPLQTCKTSDYSTNFHSKMKDPLHKLFPVLIAPMSGYTDDQSTSIFYLLVSCCILHLAALFRLPFRCWSVLFQSIDDHAASIQGSPSNHSSG